MNLSLTDAETLASQALEASGVQASAAQTTAKSLVRADADGMASHGLSRVPQYAGHVRVGRVNAKALPCVVASRPAAAVVDAQEGFAFPAMQLAVSEAAVRAKAQGVSFIAVANSHHFGVAGHFAEDLARQGLIGLVMGNSPAAMPMWGGRRAVFGTNPIAAAFPRANKADPVLIDLSLSAVARGKLMVASQKGESIPQGWALNSKGEPTTDPKEGLSGMMVPAGGAKGAMLAFMVEALCVAVSNSAYGFEADSFFELQGNRPRIAQAVLAIDIGLQSQDGYFQRMEDLIAFISQDPEVRLPGERRFGLRRQAEQNGISISDDLHKQLKELAQ